MEMKTLCLESHVLKVADTGSRTEKKYNIKNPITRQITASVPSKSEPFEAMKEFNMHRYKILISNR